MTSSTVSPSTASSSYITSLHVPVPSMSFFNISRRTGGCSSHVETETSRSVECIWMKAKISDGVTALSSRRNTRRFGNISVPRQNRPLDHRHARVSWMTNFVSVSSDESGMLSGYGSDQTRVPST